MNIKKLDKLIIKYLKTLDEDKLILTDSATRWGIARDELELFANYVNTQKSKKPKKMRLKKLAKLARKEHGKGWIAADEDLIINWYRGKPVYSVTEWMLSDKDSTFCQLPEKYTGNKHCTKTLIKVEGEE